MMTFRPVSMGCCTALLTLFILGHASAAAPPTQKTPARTPTSIRSSDVVLIETLDLGVARSATLRELESRLEGSSVIVYLERAKLPAGLAGRTRFMGAGDRWRFLSVEVDEGVGAFDLLVTVGHELQHVLEIADAADVIDASSLEALYRRIGMESGGEEGRSHWYETREAQDMGRRVRMELSGWAWAKGSLPRHS